MPSMTGGWVICARTVQPTLYESKRVETELSFVLALSEDAAAALVEVGALVCDHVLILVGQSAREGRRRSKSRED